MPSTTPRIQLPASIVASGLYEEFAKGPGARHGRSNSLKWPWLYDKLRAKGYDKSKAAAISNSRIGVRKNGRISVLRAAQAHNPAVLKRLAAADRAGKHSTKGSLKAAAEFACDSKICAPPPVGVGGSRLGNLRKLSTPDSGFTLSLKLVSLRTGFAVALGGSDRLVTADSGFDGGEPSDKLISLVRGRLDAAMTSPHPKGTKVALGGWHNPKDGKIEINVTVVFPKHKEREAMAFAKEQNQISLFSLHEGRTIETGGTGGERQTE